MSQVEKPIKELGRRFSQKKRINPQGAKREPPEIPLNPPFFKGGDYSPPFIKGRLGGISGMAKQFWSFIISYPIKNLIVSPGSLRALREKCFCLRLCRAVSPWLFFERGKS